MTETDEAFWQAIGATPVDQLPRLVFADWLEERAVEMVCGQCGNTVKDGRKCRKGYIAVEMTPDHLCPLCGEPGVWRRGVHFDHEMRCGREACAEANGSSHWEPGREGIFVRKCPACDGTGYVPDGRADMAAALRATADRVPELPRNHLPSSGYTWSWVPDDMIGAYQVKYPGTISRSLYVGIRSENGQFHQTAAYAIRDLCRAWCKVHRGVKT